MPKHNSWTVTVEQDGNDLILPLPQDLLDLQGWIPGDTLIWNDRGDGTWDLRKKVEPCTQISNVPAQGQRGFLIRTLDTHVFRQYDADHNFVDYDITNYDCEVEIVDPDAALVQFDNGDCILDYTSESMEIVKWPKKSNTNTNSKSN